MEPNLTPTQPIQKQTRSSTPVLLLLIIIALVVGGAALILVTTKADEQEQTDRMTGIENRLKKIETENEYAAKQVDKKKYQAVFLSNNQVYFGKITGITKDILTLEDIFYLQSGSVDKAGNSTSGGDVSLIKLGNELHAPEDVMNIERKNVQFYENLKDDGDVAKGIAEYKKTH
jgi:hypothetical protein